MAEHATSTLGERAFMLVYRPEATNFCPGCGRTNWYVGRMVAECAFCATALPLRDSPLVATGQRRNIRSLAA